VGRQAVGRQAVDPFAAGPRLRLDPEFASVTVGETVTVEVRIEEVAALYGWEASLEYDATKLAVQDADPVAEGVQISYGDFLPAQHRTALINTVDVASGRIHVAAALTGEMPGVAGDGVVARVVFQALALGGSDVRILSAELRDDAYPDSNPIDVSVQNATIDVRPTPAGEPPAVPTPAGTPTSTPVATEPPPATPGEPGATATATAWATEPRRGPSATPQPGARGYVAWLPWAVRR
jgi:cell division septation protein DedD